MIVDPSEVLLDLGLSTAVTEEERAVVESAILRAEGAIREYIRYDPVLGVHTEFHPQQPFQAQISRGIWEVMEQRAVLRQVSEAATNELQLRHLPVRETLVLGVSQLQVWVDYDGRSGSQATSFRASTKKTEGPDFWANYDSYDSAGLRLCRDGVLRTIGLWPTTPGTVKVSYYAGYSSKELHGQDSAVSAVPIWTTVLEEAKRRVRRAMMVRKGRIGWLAGVLQSEGLGDYNYSVNQNSLQQLFSGELMAESRERLSEFVNWGISLGA